MSVLKKFMDGNILSFIATICGLQSTVVIVLLFCIDNHIQSVLQ